MACEHTIKSLVLNVRYVRLSDNYRIKTIGGLNMGGEPLAVIDVHDSKKVRQTLVDSRRANGRGIMEGSPRKITTRSTAGFGESMEVPESARMRIAKALQNPSTGQRSQTSRTDTKETITCSYAVCATFPWTIHSSLKRSKWCVNGVETDSNIRKSNN